MYTGRGEGARGARLANAGAPGQRSDPKRGQEGSLARAGKGASEVCCMLKTASDWAGACTERNAGTMRQWVRLALHKMLKAGPPACTGLVLPRPMG